MTKNCITIFLLLAASTLQNWPEGLPGCASSTEGTSFYPRAALEKGLEGEVILRCIVGPGSRFRRCSVASETPDGVGFGVAALGMAKCEGDGKVAGSVGSLRILPVHFRLPGSADPHPGGGITVTSQLPAGAVH